MRTDKRAYLSLKHLVCDGGDLRRRQHGVRRDLLKFLLPFGIYDVAANDAEYEVEDVNAVAVLAMHLKIGWCAGLSAAFLVKTDGVGVQRNGQDACGCVIRDARDCAANRHRRWVEVHVYRRTEMHDVRKVRYGAVLVSQGDCPYGARPERQRGRKGGADAVCVDEEVAVYVIYDVEVYHDCLLFSVAADRASDAQR